MLFSLAEAAGSALTLATFNSNSLTCVAEEVSIIYIKPAVTDITTEVSLANKDIAAIASEVQATGRAILQLKCRLIDTHGEMIAITTNRYQIVRPGQVDATRVSVQGTSSSKGSTNSTETSS